MASKKKKERPSARPRRTAIVPRVVFQTLVATAVIPSMAAIAGCDPGTTTTDSGLRDGGFGVADSGPPNDAGRDAGFGVAADVGPPPVDAGRDVGFGVADVGPPPDDAGTFAVALPFDGGFSVAVPLDDGGTFSVAAPPADAAG